MALHTGETSCLHVPRSAETQRRSRVARFLFGWSPFLGGFKGKPKGQQDILWALAPEKSRSHFFKGFPTPLPPLANTRGFRLTPEMSGNNKIQQENKQHQTSAKYNWLLKPSLQHIKASSNTHFKINTCDPRRGGHFPVSRYQNASWRSPQVLELHLFF